LRPLIIGRPLWLPRGGRRLSPAYGSLDRDLEVDVAVIGGGVTGSIIAAVFADAGVQVALVEAGLIGHGSTAASTALLLREPDASIGELARRFGLARAVRIWQLSTDAARGLVRSLKHFDVDCDLTELDSVYYTTKLGKVDWLRAEFRRRQKAGLKAAWLTPRVTTADGHIGLRRHSKPQRAM
jgi:glycine/D-amino acid oxidase-like deaminating enzyme